MEYLVRKEMEALSQEILGKPSRYKKLLTKPQYTVKQDPVSGLTYKVASYMTEEEVHKLLLDLKQQKDNQTKLAEVQEAAGTVGST